MNSSPVVNERSLPVIDFAGATDAELAARIDAAFTGIGFCYFAGIGVDPALVDGVFAASRRFHALPRRIKDALAMNADQRLRVPPSDTKRV